MPTPPKKTENMTKHLTVAEIEARETAAADVQPHRDVVKLTPPVLMKKDTPASRYWKNILLRMDGLALLDDLDAEALGVYCVMLSRYEALGKLRKTFAKQDVDEMTPKELIDFTASLNALESKLQALERNLLTFAEKLGLTPSGRARLAARRAEGEAEDDPNSDLFA